MPAELGGPLTVAYVPPQTTDQDDSETDRGAVGVNEASDDVAELEEDLT